MTILVGAAPTASLDVHVIGLRAASGMIRICLTANPKAFPDCDGDPAARHKSVAAAQAGDVRFDDLAPGDYAVSLFHDQNGNGRLDKMLIVPTEGIGFSNNPRLRFGPPSFAQARIAVTGHVEATVALRYFL
ncbi:DUF2141 domain-containing protein [Sphingomonas quercus]|uniref:DUF2141 domain-containing protein n=1 Tax=Sphingomonas quercus TaxID=2842451 RepID=A0ABS6BGQ7_9SPHN|nr:DUF2141 domain-containing protein [Sphingomonas quercus]MBU3077477.1 DUF2141 domain-containing protein [Sphingomonas quercus]